MRSRNSLNPIVRYLLVGAIAMLLAFWGIDGPHFAAAQTNRIARAAAQVYAQMPDLPREDQYVLASSGKVQAHNTLLYRLISYHTRTKRRAPLYRFDWKLTLADYLGAYEVMVNDRYPTASVLTENPIDRDRELIQQLNRKEREILVNTLVVAFGGELPSAPPPPKPEVQPEPPKPAPAPPALPQPGDSRLLL